MSSVRGRLHINTFSSSNNPLTAAGRPPLTSHNKFRVSLDHRMVTPSSGGMLSSSYKKKRGVVQAFVKSSDRDAMQSSANSPVFKIERGGLTNNMLNEKSGDNITTSKDPLISQVKNKNHALMINDRTTRGGSSVNFMETKTSFSGADYTSKKGIRTSGHLGSGVIDYGYSSRGSFLPGANNAGNV